MAATTQTNPTPANQTREFARDCIRKVERREGAEATAYGLLCGLAYVRAIAVLEVGEEQAAGVEREMFEKFTRQAMRRRLREDASPRRPPVPGASPGARRATAIMIDLAHSCLALNGTVSDNSVLDATVSEFAEAVSGLLGGPPEWADVKDFLSAREYGSVDGPPLPQSTPNGEPLH